MAEKTQNALPDGDLARTLHDMGCCRGACIAVMTTSAINSAVYREAEELRKRIDRMAGLLTGDETYFYEPGHSSRG